MICLLYINTMKTTRFFALFFIIMFAIETFYPIGDILKQWIGIFAPISGCILFVVGVYSCAIEISEFRKRICSNNE